MLDKAEEVEYSVDWLINVVEFDYLDGYKLFHGYDMQLEECCWIQVDATGNIFISYLSDPTALLSGMWLLVCQVAA